MRTLTDLDSVEGDERWYTQGKQNVASMPAHQRVKHGVRMCMAEAGHAAPDWSAQLEDVHGLSLPHVPQGLLKASNFGDWRACLKRSLHLVAEMHDDLEVAGNNTFVMWPRSDHNDSGVSPSQ